MFKGVAFVLLVVLALHCGVALASTCPESNGHKWVCSACYDNACSLSGGCSSFCMGPATNLTSCLAELPGSATGWICWDTAECIVFGSFTCTFEDGLSGGDIFWIVCGCLTLVSILIFGAIAVFQIVQRRRKYGYVNI